MNLEYSNKMFKRILTILSVLGILTPFLAFAVAAELSTTILFSDANLEAYYKLEDTADSGSHGYTLTNNGTVGFTAAKFNNGGDLGASNTTKYFNNNTNAGVDGGACSWSAWINPTTLPGNNTWASIVDVSNSNTKTSNGIALYNNGGTQEIRFYRQRVGVNTDSTNYAITLSTGTLYHLAYTYDGSNVRGYLNGVLVAGPTALSGNGNYGSTIDVLKIGSFAGTAGFSQGFSGIVDDAAFFSRALTASEVEGLALGFPATASTCRIRGQGRCH